MENEQRLMEFHNFFEAEKNRNAKNIIATQKIFGEVGNAVTALHELSRKSEEATKIDLKNYLNYLTSNISFLNDDVKALQFLLNEKQQITTKLIEAKIQKNGYDRKYYQSVIDDILEPLILELKTKLQLQRSVPSINQIVISPAHVLQENIPATQISESIPKVIEENILSEKAQSYPNLLIGFKQISCHATKEQILNYFMILSKAVNPLNGKPYMNEQDIMEMLQKNFAIFGAKPNGKYFSINLFLTQKGVLRYFLYLFYQKYESNFRGSKIKYVNFLIHNFELFKYDNADTLGSNMSETKKPRAESIINISKYLTK